MSGVLVADYRVANAVTADGNCAAPTDRNKRRA